MSSAPLSSPVALVIGGTRGLGRVTALALAGEGFNVFACGRNALDVDALRAEGRERGLPIDGMPCDAADEAALDGFVKAALERHGRIDSLVFAAGRAFPGNALQLTAAQWDDCFRINLRAPFLAARAVLPPMVAAGGGTLVFVSTIWAFTTPRDRLAYLAAKSGLPALVRGLAVDHAGQGIRANAVAPGYVDTAFLHQSIEAVHGADKVADQLADVLRAHPAGRLVAPDEVAQAICFLVGARSGGVNGQTLIVDGAAATRFSLADAWRTNA